MALYLAILWGQPVLAVLVPLLVWPLHPLRSEARREAVLFLLVGLVALGLAMLATVLLGTTGMFLATVVDVAFVSFVFDDVREARGIARLLRRADVAETRDQAVEGLRKLLETQLRAKRTRAGAPRSQRLIARELAGRGLLDEAIGVLRLHTPEARYKSDVRGHANDLGAYLLRRGAIAEARAALESVPRDGKTALDEALRTNHALLQAVDERPDAALAELAIPVSRKWPAMHATRALARAHALAARGDRDGARDALRELIALEGRGALGRARAPEGPATAVAAELEAESQGAYR